MTSGIYKITINNKVYVGKANSLEKREKQHLRDLKRNDHYNHFLQEAYNTYGEYSFEVIEECEKQEMNNRERYWVDKLDARNRSVGYNICRGGNGAPPWSDEMKKWKSQATMDVLNHNYYHGAPADKIAFDKYENKMSVKELMEKYKCSKATIVRRLRKWHKDNGIEYKKQQNIFPQMRIDIDLDSLLEDRKSGMTYAQLQKKYRCGAGTLFSRLGKEDE